ncbi:MAG TPA: tetratricopeptide repeat protein, partial [Steroidobacteraceae bacterium]|nr:tetratricopeptide repeat protein [Steroidobacteraceae bacterium]
ADQREAASTLTAAYEAAAAHYPAAHPLTLRAEIAVAQLGASQGNYAPAERQLAEAAAGLRKLGAQSSATLAMALENLGTVESAQGRNTEAETALREAVSIRQKTPDDVWELAQAQERLGEALAKSGGADAPALLKKASFDLESQLGANHPQTLRAKAALKLLGT